MEIYSSILKLEENKQTKKQPCFQELLREALLRNLSLLKQYSSEFRNISRKMLPYKLSKFVTTAKESIHLEKTAPPRRSSAPQTQLQKICISKPKYQIPKLSPIMQMEHVRRIRKRVTHTLQYKSKQEMSIIDIAKTENQFVQQKLVKMKVGEQPNNKITVEKQKCHLSKVYVMHKRVCKSIPKGLVFQKKQSLFESEKNKSFNKTQRKQLFVQYRSKQKSEQRTPQIEFSNRLMEEKPKRKVVWIGNKENIFGENIRIILFNKEKQEAREKLKVLCNATNGEKPSEIANNFKKTMSQKNIFRGTLQSTLLVSFKK